jgi:hypothetical protein
MRRQCALGARSRTIGGSGGVTEEREREHGDEKLLSAARESIMPKILVHET